MRSQLAPAPLALAIILVLAISGCGSSSSAPAAPTATATSALATIPAGSSFTAALVTDVGGIHDRSFNQMAWAGLRAEKALKGISVEYAQPKTAGNYLPLLRHFARQQASIVIAVGYAMSRAVYAVAQQYPTSHFAMIDARPIGTDGHETTLPNVTDIFFQEQESGFLAGTIAGLMEKHHIGKAKHNTVGYLGGGNVPEVNLYLAGFVNGVRHVDPTVHVVGQYATSFTDAAQGKRIGEQQIASGADVLFQVAATTGTGYLQAAQQRGVYGIGVDTDESFLGPFVLTSAVKRVDVAVRLIVDQLLSGHFTPGDLSLGGKQGATGFGTPSPLVPRTIVNQALAIQGQIDRGVLTIPSTFSG